MYSQKVDKLIAIIRRTVPHLDVMSFRRRMGKYDPRHVLEGRYQAALMRVTDAQLCGNKAEQAAARANLDIVYAEWSEI